MIYPYTAIKSEDIDFIHKFLVENGFQSDSPYDINYYKSFDYVYCVCDNAGFFW